MELWNDTVGVPLEGIVLASTHAAVTLNDQFQTVLNGICATHLTLKSLSKFVKNGCNVFALEAWER
jgi:hypothetical protein